MDFNFRPQWRQWSYSTCYKPTCGRCGKVHLDVPCLAMNRKCYNCGKFGHYSRMCQNQNTPTSSKEDIKSRSQRERDNKRISRYLERKNILRELPFSSLRIGQFSDCVSDNSALKEELKRTKSKLKSSKLSGLNGKDNAEHQRKVSELEKKNSDLSEKLNAALQQIDCLKTTSSRFEKESLELKDKVKLLSDENAQKAKRIVEDATESFHVLNKAIQDRKELYEKYEAASKMADDYFEDMKKLREQVTMFETLMPKYSQFVKEQQTSVHVPEQAKSYNSSLPSESSYGEYNKGYYQPQNGHTNSGYYQPQNGHTNSGYYQPQNGHTNSGYYQPQYGHKSDQPYHYPITVDVDDSTEVRNAGTRFSWVTEVLSCTK